MVLCAEDDKPWTLVWRGMQISRSEHRIRGRPACCEDFIMLKLLILPDER